MSPFITLSVIAGILAVDHRAGWQSLMAQPVFAALLIGSLIGELWIALTVGLALELIYLSIVPMRGARIPDAVAAGVVGAGTASLLMHHTGDPRFAFVSAVGVLMGLLAGEIGARLTTPLFAFQNRVLSGIEIGPHLSRRNTINRIFLLHVLSVGFIFVVEGLAVLLLSWAGYYAGHRFTLLIGGTLVEGAVHWSFLVPAIGAASLVHLFWQHHLRRVLLVCAILVVTLLWLG